MARGASQETLNLPNPWSAVGRDTAAGRALFALYNGFGQARNRGNNYSTINRIRTSRYIATNGVPEFPVPKSPPPKKPKVKVPHFYPKHSYFDDIHPVELIPRRRRASHILQQLRIDSFIVDRPPAPKGPLLDEAEKARLQELFYWSNRNIGPDPPEVEPVRIPKKGSIEEQEQMLNNISKEIEERRAFLNEMESYGKADEYRSQIMFQIQQRMGEMKLLHENISKMDKEYIEDQSRKAVDSLQVQNAEGRQETSTRLNTASSRPDDDRIQSNSSQQADTENPSRRTSKPETGYKSSQCTSRPETSEYRALATSYPATAAPTEPCKTRSMDTQLSAADLRSSDNNFRVMSTIMTPAPLSNFPTPPPTAAATTARPPTRHVATRKKNQTLNIASDINYPTVVATMNALTATSPTRTCSSPHSEVPSLRSIPTSRYITAANSP